MLFTEPLEIFFSKVATDNAVSACFDLWYNSGLEDKRLETYWRLVKLRLGLTYEDNLLPLVSKRFTTRIRKRK